jgi:hypothetical protein
LLEILRAVLALDVLEKDAPVFLPGWLSTAIPVSSAASLVSMVDTGSLAFLMVDQKVLTWWLLSSPVSATISGTLSPERSLEAGTNNIPLWEAERVEPVVVRLLRISSILVRDIAPTPTWSGVTVV